MKIRIKLLAIQKQKVLRSRCTKDLTWRLTPSCKYKLTIKFVHDIAEFDQTKFVAVRINLGQFLVWKIDLQPQKIDHRDT